MAVTVTTLLPVPETRFSVNQVALSLADQVNVPPPWLLIFKVWVAGLTPRIAVKERLVGLIPIAGGTGAVATVSVTGTVTDEAPEACRVTVLLYVPAAKLPLVTVNVTAPFPIPEAGLSVNQAALSLAVHVSVPPPWLLMVKVWVAGLALPCVAAKERFTGLTPIAGSTTGGGAEAGV